MLNTAQIGVVAGLLGLAGYVPYVCAMRTGKTHPSRAGWFIWAGVGFMLLATNHATGTRDAIWIPLAYFLGPLGIAGLAIKYGKGGWEFSDKLCLVLAGASMVLWYTTGSAEVALFACLLADGAGSWSTLKKAYLEPGGEDKWAWRIWSCANMLNLFAVQDWNWVLGAYPVYLAVTAGLIAAFVHLSPHRAAP